MATVVALALLVGGCSNSTGRVRGADGIGDDYFPRAGNGGYQVESYDVAATVTIEGADHLEATATISAVSTQELDSFDLDLVGLEVEEVTVDGVAARWDHPDRELVVTPDEPLAADRPFTVVVTYQGDPSGGEGADVILDNGGGWLDLGDYSAVLAQPVGTATWIPSNDHPSDKARFSIDVTVASPLVAVSNGRLVERRQDAAGGAADGAVGGGVPSTIFRWTSDEPMAPYLMTLAVGEFDLVERPMSTGGPTILDAYPPADRPLGDATFGPFGEMVQFFSSQFGAYPFTEAGNVIVPGLPDTAFESQTRSIFSRSLLRQMSTVDREELVAHELAHQWFGDAVSPARWSDIWLSEGLAVYSQWLWTEHRGGPTVAGSASNSYDPTDEDFDVPSADPGVDELFGTSVYVRSAIFLVELRARMGEAKFSELLRTWIDEHRYASATTAQFEALANEINGESLDDLTQQWLHGDELPELSFG